MLADPTAVLVVSALFYWFVDHERGGFFVATTLFALSLTVAAKQLLAMGRPPSALWLAEADGYGFPSGHSVGAVVIYGYLAADLSVATRRIRYGVATLLAGGVGLSRVALGVHYPADVLAGFALGLAVLAAGVAFFAAVGAVLGGAAVVVGGSFLLVLGILSTPHLSQLASSAVDRGRYGQAQ